MRTRWLVLAALLVSTGDVAAQERQRPTRAENRAIEKILSLEREIAALMAALPPHLRDVVRERLAREATAKATAARAAAEREAAAKAAQVAKERPDDAAGAPEMPADTEAEIDTTTTEIIPKATSCTTLWTFDTDRNGRVDGLDRYWRHFYLWTDANGDGVVAEAEVKSAYDRGVRDIAVALDVFVRRKKDTVGEIEVAEYIVLDVAGNGFGGLVGRAADDGALVVDASRLARGDGPALLATDETPLVGYQPLRAGLRLRLASGEVVALSCP